MDASVVEDTFEQFSNPTALDSTWCEYVHMCSDAVISSELCQVLDGTGALKRIEGQPLRLEISDTSLKFDFDSSKLDVPFEKVSRLPNSDPVDDV